jgi:hypothetical protein
MRVAAELSLLLLFFFPRKGCAKAKVCTMAFFAARHFLITEKKKQRGRLTHVQYPIGEVLISKPTRRSA